MRNVIWFHEFCLCYFDYNINEYKQINEDKKKDFINSLETAPEQIKDDQN